MCCPKYLFGVKFPIHIAQVNTNILKHGQTCIQNSGALEFYQAKLKILQVRRCLYNEIFRNFDKL